MRRCFNSKKQTNKRFFKSLTGFTLIELMVTISILSIGIVTVLRSFLNITSALDISSNQINALHLLERKLNQLEEESMRYGGLELKQEQEDIMVGSRVGVLSLETEVLDIEKKDDSEVGNEEEEELKRLNIVNLTAKWKEGKKVRKLKLLTYFPSKEIE